MKIRTKVIACLAALFAAQIVLQAVLQSRALLPSFVALEREEGDTAIRRVDVALDRVYDWLENMASGWGNSIETYQFVDDHNQAYLDVNLNEASVSDMGVDAFVIADQSGHIVVSVGFAPESRKLITANFFGTDTELPANFPWRSILHERQRKRGMWRTSQGIFLFAAAPVFDGTEHGASHGLVLAGKRLSPELVEHIAMQAQNALSVAPRIVPAPSQIIQTPTLLSAYRTLSDVHGRALVTLRADLPRRVTAYGVRSIHYASIYLICASICVLLLLVWFLNLIILRPLEGVTRHAVAIGAGKDLSARLAPRGNDEISRLGVEFDRMVSSLAESQRKLVDQSFEAGFAELAKGLLHNLGNAMTPVGVRLQSLEQRLKSTPLSDLKLAIEALAQEKDAARRAELLEFLRLGCDACQTDLGHARADMEVIARQTQLVQASIAEPLGPLRKAPVVESVDLSDLVQQTLEIVPDESRNRLEIAEEDSLRRIGPVRIARSVMRLVLQNLLINSADAISQAGRERGRLQIAAEIIPQAGRDELHLSCSDDGIGIAAENLQRVFEKGYSTKSRRTNMGIGLHWCANAIAELEGRIWAASDGVGRGAVMHLVVPLPKRQDAYGEVGI